MVKQGIGRFLGPAWRLAFEGSTMFNLALLALIPFIALFLPELIIRGSLAATLSWISSYPNQFLAGYAIVFGLINIFYILPRRIYGACGVLFVTLFSVAGFISRQKLLLRGEPLLHWDFVIGKEALNISKSFELLNLVSPILLIEIVSLAVIVFIAFLFTPKEKYPLHKKVAVALLSISILLTTFQSNTLEKTFALHFINWNQKANCEENGMMLAFVLNAKCQSVEEPGFYQAGTIETIVRQCVPSYAVDRNFSPNIILVMSEAFWDPTVLPGISFSEDPLPYFHALQHKHNSGVMLAPVYGGGTANTEFEVLTGFSTQFLPQGVIPYIQFVHKPIEALPAILKKQGYAATAIHTYDDWFYRRNSVYPNLGFECFISKDSFSNPEYSGPYIRDTELSQRILQVLEQTDKPDFIFAISMQAHGPYSNMENPDLPIKISAELEPETRFILENYTNIISDVDKSLELLIEGLKMQNEPTMVVFFGDHLPMLGNDCEVYKEAGYFQNDSSYDDYLKKYSVPIIVWDNFSNRRESLRLSSSFLSSYVLSHSKKTGTPLTDFLYTLSQKGSNLVTAAQHLHHENITKEQFTQYEILQYDFLIGNKYAYALNPYDQPLTNPQYALIHNPVVIE